jgi:hypothetical protein
MGVYLSSASERRQKPKARIEEKKSTGKANTPENVPGMSMKTTQLSQ